MKYTYKKASSRSPIYGARRTQLTKALFWTELLSFIGKGEVVINLDESSFDRSTKSEFSWLPVEESCQIINDRLKGRASLILATWNTSEWLAMVVLDTIKSQKFWFFLKILKEIISRWDGNNQISPIVIFWQCQDPFFQNYQKHNKRARFAGEILSTILTRGSSSRENYWKDKIQMESFRRKHEHRF